MALQVPEAPGKPAVSGISSTVLTLKWTAPVDEIHCTGYRIDAQAFGGEWQVRVKSTTNLKTCRAVMSLEPETSYRFKVYAINRIGLGPPSAASEAVTTRPDLRINAPKLRKVTPLNRPKTAPVRRPQITGDSKDEKLVRRRYFFRGDVLDGAACEPNSNVFNYHYDVVALDHHTREKSLHHRSPWTPVAKLDEDVDVETLYYQDHKLHGNSYALQNNLHTAFPQGKLDLPRLLGWITGIRPRHTGDALPMFVLIQNVTRSLLEDKIKGSRMMADKEELSRLRTSNQELRKQLLNLDVALQQGCDEQIRAVEHKAAASDAETARLRIEIANINARWKQKLTASQDECKMLSNQVRSLVNSKETMQTKLKQAHEKNSVDAQLFAAERQSLNDQLSGMNDQLSSMNDQLLRQHQEIQELQKALTQAGPCKAEPPTTKEEERFEVARTELTAAHKMVLGMRSKIAELKGYSVEPKHATAVRGVLELLGSGHGEKMETWDQCRGLLGADVIADISNFDPRRQNDKLVVLCNKWKGAVEGMERDQVDKGSEAVGCLFGWLVAAIGAVDAAAELEGEAASEAEKAAEGESAAHVEGEQVGPEQAEGESAAHVEGEQVGPEQAEGEGEDEGAGVGVGCCEASPEIYKELGECLGGKLMHMTLKKGERDQPHDHPSHVMYVIKGGTLKITGAPNPAGETSETELLDGAGACMPGGAHQVENVGESDVEILLFEQGEQVGETPEGHVPPQETDGDQYKTLAENEAWVVVEVTLKAGEEDHPHSHRDHLVYVLEGEQLTIHPGQEKVAEPMVLEIAAGAVLPIQPGFHIVENTGSKDARLVYFESKR